MEKKITELSKEELKILEMEAESLPDEEIENGGEIDGNE